MDGAVRGVPRALLRVEGGVVLAVSVAFYVLGGGGWGLFAVLFLVPDVSMLGYFAGPVVGAAAYNAGHSYVVPAVLGAVGVLGGYPLAVLLALIWVAHIGFDRLVGYGLKYGTAFGDTHLGRVGGRGRALPGYPPSR
jgi:hypothetical protein